MPRKHMRGEEGLVTEKAGSSLASHSEMRFLIAE